MIETALLFLAILLIAVFTSLAAKMNWLKPSFARKILHVGAIGISAFSVYLIPQREFIIWFVGPTLPISFILVYKGFFKEGSSGRRSWGIWYYHLVFLGLLLLAPSKELVFYPLIILALADGFAAIVGELSGSKPIKMLRNTKTLPGSIAFLITSIACLAILPEFFPSSAQLITLCSGILIISFFLSLVEVLSGKGRDNLWIPLFVIYWMILKPDISETYGAIVLISLLFLGIIAFRFGLLNPSGAIAACLLGFLILISPEPIWIAVALTFFGIGSILSKLPGKTSQSEESTRTEIQVFANGLVPVGFMMMYFLTQNEAWILGGACGFGAALSDTASSEIGMRLKGQVFSILNFRKVPSGLSGGISVYGSIAGILFALPIALMVSYISDIQSVEVVFGIAGISFLGNLIDSLSGALFQRKFYDEISQKWSDKPPKNGAIRESGFRFIDNNMVNFITTSFACVMGWFWFSFY